MDHDPPSRLTATPALAFFAALWAAAALFHVWVSDRASGFFDDPSLVGASHLAVAAAAIAVLVWPSRVPLLLGLCGVELWSLWHELPVVGNHWVLVGLIDVGVLSAAASGSVARALPVARWTLLAFYGFAAFAKLNSGFVDPVASCGSFFFRESASSLHLDGVADAAAGTSVLAWAAVLGTLLVELSLPVLLVMRRTRTVGVVVGLVFHALVALDQAHPFSDFSAALTALFVLFLPSDVAVWIRARLGDRVTTGLRVVAVLGGAVVTGLRLAEPRPTVERAFTDLRSIAWVAMAVVVIGLVVAYLWVRREDRVASVGLRLPARWLAVVPLLAVANGLTPYLELKTAFGWNMYSNLRTVDGDSNHLVVVATLPLTDAQEGLVRLLSSSDPGLQLYVDLGYDLPWLEFRGYLSRHPDVAVRYERFGEVHDLARASDDLDLVRPLSLAQEKLLVFRAVDRQDPPRCQPGFLPAH